MTVQRAGAFVATTDSAAIRSTDNGETWNTISKEFPSGWNARFVASIGDHLFNYDSSQVLYHSTHHGLTWEPLPFQWGRYSVSAIDADTTGTSM